MPQVIRSVLEVDASKATAGFATAGKAAAGYGRSVTLAGAAEAKVNASMGRLSGSIRANRDSWDKLSSTAMLAGGGVAVGLGLATKAAIGWESSWAGVTKTVDGTPAQMAELEAGLRGLAKELPATHEELAGVAEAAGQLGVARKDILGFTETAVALGESTNLSAEEASESLAKFSNIMGTAAREGVVGYEKLGSTLVALGNDGASTERDIMQMALRLAGAGKQIGATEADILAMSNALSSVGIEAELGGGAMSRAMLQMNSAVISGGDELDKFAGIAGMSAEAFATAWRDDPIQATNAFVTGLGKIGESGGDASAALDSVGLSGTQNAQVLLRAAGASDLMTESLSLGATAWEKNNALQEEAAKRYETTESKLQIAKNSLNDAAIDLGASFGPMAAGVAGEIAGIADAFVKLPGPVKGAVSSIAGFTAGTLLIGGAAVKTIGFAQDLGDAISAVDTKFGGADGSARGWARGAAYATAAMVALAAAGKAVDKAVGNVAFGSEEAGNMLLDLAENGKAAESATTGMRLRWDDLNKTMEYGTSDAGIGGNVLEFLSEVGTLGGAFGPTQRDDAETFFKNIDTGLVELMNTGQQVKAMEIFDKLVAETDGSEQALARLNDRLPGFSTLAKQAGVSADGAGGEIAGLGTDAEQAEQATKDLTDAIRNLGDTLLQQEASQDGYEASLDAVTASIKENGNTLDANTEAGRANRSALRDLANSTQEWAAAELEATGSVKNTQKILDDGRAAWVRHRDAMGANKTETRELAAELFKIDDLEPKAKLDVETEQASKKTRDFQNLITGTNGLKGTATVEERGAVEARDKVVDFGNKILGLTGKTVPVGETGSDGAKSRVMAFNERIVDLSGKTVTVTEVGAVGARGRVDSLRQGIAVINGKTVTVTEIGSTDAGGRVVSFKNKIYEVPPERTSNLRANVHGLWDIQAMKNAIDGIQSKSVVVRAISVGAAIGIAAGQERGGIRAGGVQKMEQGGVVGAGKMMPGIYKTSKAGILMAEDTRAPAEAYISLRRDLKPRSRAIANEVVGMLGGQVHWGDVTAMASGGVYSRWKKELRDVRALANSRQYRWEDGSRMISVFEDGTARWGGYGSAPSSVAREIAQLNAAQDAYENALNAPKAAPKAKKAWQHDPQWYVDQRRFAANKAKKAKPKWEHSPQYWVDQERFADNKRKAAAKKASPKSWAGSAFQRSTPIEHASRTYVAPQMSRSSSIGSGGNSATYVTISDAQFRRLEAANERGAYRGAFAGTAQQRRNELASATTTPRGRTR